MFVSNSTTHLLPIGLCSLLIDFVSVVETHKSFTSEHAASDTRRHPLPATRIKASMTSLYSLYVDCCTGMHPNTTGYSWERGQKYKRSAFNHNIEQSIISICELVVQEDAGLLHVSCSKLVQLVFLPRTAMTILTSISILRSGWWESASLDVVEHGACRDCRKPSASCSHTVRSVTMFALLVAIITKQWINKFQSTSNTQGHPSLTHLELKILIRLNVN